MANQTVVWTYRVRPGVEDEFLAVLTRQWPTLHELGFATATPAMIYRSVQDPPTYVEIFTWTEGSPGPAHDHPDVIDIWEAIEPLLEERDGHPKQEYPLFEQVKFKA